MQGLAESNVSGRLTRNIRKTYCVSCYTSYRTDARRNERTKLAVDEYGMKGLVSASSAYRSPLRGYKQFGLLRF